MGTVGRRAIIVVNLVIARVDIDDQESPGILRTNVLPDLLIVNGSTTIHDLVRGVARVSHSDHLLSRWFRRQRYQYSALQSPRTGGRLPPRHPHHRSCLRIEDSPRLLRAAAAV